MAEKNNNNTNEGTTEPKPEKKRKHYITNAMLLPEIERARELGYVTDELANMFMIMVDQYIKSYRWRNYTYKDDMKSNALQSLVKGALKFDPDRTKNPFAYYTQTIKNAFKQTLKHEKHHRDGRDKLLVEAGLDPSYSYQQEHFNNDDYFNESNLATEYKEVDITNVDDQIWDHDNLDQ